MQQIFLPREIRRCPSCHMDGFQAQKAGLGGSWGGRGIQFLYVCPQCHHQEKVEHRASRRATALSGVILMLFGLLMGFLLDAPGNGIVGFLLIGLGGYAVWTGQIAFDRRAPIVGMVEGERAAIWVDDDLSLSPEEAAKGAVRNRQTAYLIYGIVGLTLFYCLYELIWMA